MYIRVRFFSFPSLREEHKREAKLIHSHTRDLVCLFFPFWCLATISHRQQRETTRKKIILQMFDFLLLFTKQNNEQVKWLQLHLKIPAQFFHVLTAMWVREWIVRMRELSPLTQTHWKHSMSERCCCLNLFPEKGSSFDHSSVLISSSLICCSISNSNSLIIINYCSRWYLILKKEAAPKQIWIHVQRFTTSMSWITCFASLMEASWGEKASFRKTRREEDGMMKKRVYAQTIWT